VQLVRKYNRYRATTEEDVTDRLSAYTPHSLAVLRIVAGLPGLIVLFNIPASTYPAPPEGMATLMTIAGWMELIGGAFILVGFLTRPVAFILCGMMAVAYWGFHVPMNFWPANNMGVAAILYCFIFLHLVFAGAGPWSIDGRGR
jgi:putative oxidoreductase